MTSAAAVEASNQIADVRFDDRRMYVLLQDGREISVPLWWYPRLLRATSAQRKNWQILEYGCGQPRGAARAAGGLLHPAKRRMIGFSASGKWGAGQDVCKLLR